MLARTAVGVVKRQRRSYCLGDKITSTFVLQDCWYRGGPSLASRIPHAVKVSAKSIFLKVFLANRAAARIEVIAKREE
jgi:hypothetical protein